MKLGLSYKVKSLFSKIIRWFTKSLFSHIFLVLPIKIDDDYLIIESSFLHGVSINLLSNYTKNPDFAVELYEINLQLNDIYPTIKSHLNRSYGYTQLLGYPIMKLFSLKRNPLRGGIVCSEFILDILQKSPYLEHFAHLSPNTVVPEDLYNVITNVLKLRKIES